MYFVHHSRDTPINYSSCDQTVTLYHAELAPAFVCLRTVIMAAHFEFKKIASIEKTGTSENNSFLLIVPNAAGQIYVPPNTFVALPTEQRTGHFTLVSGDRVFLGEGPQIEDAAAWREFIPAKVDGLASIKNIDPKYWRGSCCHVEASG